MLESDKGNHTFLSSRKVQSSNVRLSGNALGQKKRNFEGKTEKVIFSIEIF